MIAAYIIKQYERAVVFKLGKITGEARGPGLILVVPFVQRIRRVSLRIVTMPIQSQGIITKDNVSIDVSAVAYYRVEDPIRSVVAIENIEAAIGQIAQTTLRSVVGRHTLDELLSETEGINQNIREILDVQNRGMGRQGHRRRAQRHSAPGQHAARDGSPSRGRARKAREGHRCPRRTTRRRRVAQAADVMAAHPLALQLRNLQTLVEVAVDKNSTVVFPAPLMSTIAELGSFVAREKQAAGQLPATPDDPIRSGNGATATSSPPSPPSVHDPT